MRITARHWTAALLAALLVHASLFAAVFWQPEDQGALAAGFGGIEIGLGPAGGAPGGVPAEAADLPEAEVDAAPEAASEPLPEETIEAAEAPVEATAVEVPEATEPMPAEEAVATAEPAPPVSEPLPAELAEPAPVEKALAAAEPPAPAEEPAVQPTAAPPPPPQAKPQPPRPKEAQEPPEPATQTAAQPQPEAPQPEAPQPEAPQPKAAEPKPPATTEAVAAEAGTTAPSDAQTAALAPNAPGVEGRAGDQDAPQVGSGDGGSGGGLQALKQAYGAQLRAWLDKHKKYPRRARLRNQQGTPTIHFEIDRSGTVLVSEIEESSGYRLLDREAMKTLERANPMPEPPEELRGERLTFIVPLDFHLR